MVKRKTSRFRNFIRRLRDGPPPVPRNPELYAQVHAIPAWFHSIDLGDGVVTPGVKRSKTLAREAGAIFENAPVAGKSVLDIGAWDGFFSFEAKRRGASRVLATDHFCWVDPRGRANKSGFDLAKRTLELDVEEQVIDVSSISESTVGRFDTVLFLGVLYHLQNPMLGIERAASVCDRTLVVETHLDALDQRKPAAVFYPGRELNNDPTNWWGPNPACVEGMLRVFGFQSVARVRAPGASRRRGIFIAKR